MAYSACAWKRPLGSLPNIQLAAVKANESNGLNTLLRVKKGVPLGGIGAGNFMYNLCGTFGPWQLKVGRYEERFLSQGAFHVREKVGGQRRDDPHPGDRGCASRLDAPESGAANYQALFPRGWCTYKAFETEIGLQFFSPDHQRQLP